MRTQELKEKHARGALTPQESSELIERLDAKVTGYRLKFGRVRRMVWAYPAKYRVAVMGVLDK